MTWWISTIAGSIAGRHHRKWQKPNIVECASRRRGGSCVRSVTQWRCLNDCYRLDKTWREKLVNGTWSYCDESSDPAIPGCLPISALPSMVQRRMQIWLTRIWTHTVNVEMVTDDEGRIPAQHADFTISGFVVSSWDTRTFWTYAATICHLSHSTFHGIQRDFVRMKDSASRSVGRRWEEMTGYMAVWNHTNWVDQQNLGNSGPTSKQTYAMDSSSDHRLRPHRAYLRRWTTADCGSV